MGKSLILSAQRVSTVCPESFHALGSGRSASLEVCGHHSRRYALEVPITAVIFLGF